VAAYIQEFSQSRARPTVKQHLAGIKMLFDWLVLGQVIPANQATIVRGPAHSQKKGQNTGAHSGRNPQATRLD
jgi:integrase/recombinase XerD